MKQTEIYDPIADRVLGQEKGNQNFIYRHRYELLRKIINVVVFLMIINNIWDYRPIEIANFMQDLVWLGFVSWLPIWYIYRRQTKHSKVLSYLCIAVPIITIILSSVVSST
jgi:hypothetical protein